MSVTGPQIGPSTRLERAYEREIMEYVDDAIAEFGVRQSEAYTGFRRLLATLHGNAPNPGQQPDRVRRIAREYANRMNRWHWRKFNDSMRRYLGVRIDISDGELGEWMTAHIDENVRLIRSIPERYHAKLVQDITEASFRAPFDQAALKELLEKNYQSAGYNARRIARDQTNKAIGDLNHFRQRQVGIVEYRWSTVGDSRVRPEHAALHGKVFRWDTTPPSGHPGHAIQCRCVARPIIPTAAEVRRRQTEPPSVQAALPKDLDRVRIAPDAVAPNAVRDWIEDRAKATVRLERRLQRIEDDLKAKIQRRRVLGRKHRAWMARERRSLLRRGSAYLKAARRRVIPENSPHFRRLQRERKELKRLQRLQRAYRHRGTNAADRARQDRLKQLRARTLEEITRRRDEARRQLGLARIGMSDLVQERRTLYDHLLETARDQGLETRRLARLDAWRDDLQRLNAGQKAIREANRELRKQVRDLRAEANRFRRQRADVAVAHAKSIDKRADLLEEKIRRNRKVSSRVEQRRRDINTLEHRIVRSVARGRPDQLEAIQDIRERMLRRQVQITKLEQELDKARRAYRKADLPEWVKRAQNRADADLRMYQRAGDLELLRSTHRLNRGTLERQLKGIEREMGGQFDLRGGPAPGYDRDKIRLKFEQDARRPAAEVLERVRAEHAVNVARFEETQRSYRELRRRHVRTTRIGDPTGPDRKALLEAFRGTDDPRLWRHLNEQQRQLSQWSMYTAEPVQDFVDRMWRTLDSRDAQPGPRPGYRRHRNRPLDVPAHIRNNDDLQQWFKARKVEVLADGSYTDARDWLRDELEELGTWKSPGPGRRKELVLTPAEQVRRNWLNHELGRLGGTSGYVGGSRVDPPAPRIQQDFRAFVADARKDNQTPGVARRWLARQREQEQRRLAQRPRPQQTSSRERDQLLKDIAAYEKEYGKLQDLRDEHRKLQQGIKRRQDILAEPLTPGQFSVEGRAEDLRRRLAANQRDRGQLRLLHARRRVLENEVRDFQELRRLDLGRGIRAASETELHEVRKTIRRLEGAVERRTRLTTRSHTRTPAQQAKRREFHRQKLEEDALLEKTLRQQIAERAKELYELRQNVLYTPAVYGKKVTQMVKGRQLLAPELNIGRPGAPHPDVRFPLELGSRYGGADVELISPRQLRSVALRAPAVQGPIGPRPTRDILQAEWRSLNQKTNRSHTEERLYSWLNERLGKPVRAGSGPDLTNREIRNFLQRRNPAGYLLRRKQPQPWERTPVRYPSPRQGSITFIELEIDNAANSQTIQRWLRRQLTEEQNLRIRGPQPTAAPRTGFAGGRGYRVEPGTTTSRQAGEWIEAQRRQLNIWSADPTLTPAQRDEIRTWLRRRAGNRYSPELKSEYRRATSAGQPHSPNMPAEEFFAIELAEAEALHLHPQMIAWLEHMHTHHAAAARQGRSRTALEALREELDKTAQWSQVGRPRHERWAYRERERRHRMENEQLAGLERTEQRILKEELPRLGGIIKARKELAEMFPEMKFGTDSMRVWFLRSREDYRAKVRELGDVRRRKVQLQTELADRRHLDPILNDIILGREQPLRAAARLRSDMNDQRRAMERSAEAVTRARSSYIASWKAAREDFAALSEAHTDTLLRMRRETEAFQNREQALLRSVARAREDARKFRRLARRLDERIGEQSSRVRRWESRQEDWEEARAQTLAARRRRIGQEGVEVSPQSSPYWRRIQQLKRDIERGTRAYERGTRRMLEADQRVRRDFRREVLLTGSGGQLDVKTRGRNRTVNRAMSDFARMMPNSALPGVDGRSVTVQVSRRIQRANADLGNDALKVLVNPRDHAREVIHELGHIAEQVDPDIRRRAVAFLQRRTGRTRSRLLRETTNISAYGDERARVSRSWLDPYMGKTYSSNDAAMYNEGNAEQNPFWRRGMRTEGRYLSATEVVAMGLEWMYDDPIRLARGDPEMFDFIWRDVLKRDLNSPRPQEPVPPVALVARALAPSSERQLVNAAR